MNDKELAKIMDLLYPHFIKKLKSEGIFKNCIKNTNATVSWIDDESDTNIGKVVKVKFPYDVDDVEVINKSTSELKEGDLVCVHYCMDLKNAYVAYIARRE